MNYFKSKSGQFTDSLASILTCDANKSIHIIELVIIGDTSSRTINLTRYDNSESKSSKLLPPDFNLAVSYKMVLNNIILEENDELRAIASAASVIDFNITYIETDVEDLGS